MELYELQPYILKSCKFLGFKAQQIDSSEWNVKIPPKFRDEFNGQEEVNIGFEKTGNPNVTYVTFESYFTQKIAQLVAEANSGVSSGTRVNTIQTNLNELKKRFPDCQFHIAEPSYDESDFIIVWFKTTINLYLTEEYLKGFKYNLKTGTLESAPSSEEISEFLDAIKEELITDVSYELIDNAIQDLYAIAQEDAQTFIDEKLEENNKTLQDEIKRINEYYDLLEAENELAESSKKGLSPEEELTLLKKERKDLIDQQIKKNRFQQQEVTIEPVAILLLKEKTESAESVVENQFGQINVVLKGDKQSAFTCSVSNDASGPFTITSDNLVVKADRVFECSSCESRFGDNKKDNCIVCQLNLCQDCKQVSAISGSTLCQAHAVECQSCLNTVTSEELHLCTNCNQFYCTECNPAGMCGICHSLKPVTAITPQLKSILDEIPSDLRAKKFDVSEKGNRIVIQGKGAFFKTYLAVYDKANEKIIHIIKYKMFGRKSK